MAKKRTKTFTIGGGWKRVVAFGCSHGKHISESARGAVLNMIERFRPDYRIHLGDFWDTTAWRGGARGTADEAVAHGPDIDAGLKFLQDANINVVCIGNHEDRIYKATRHYNAIVAGLARMTINALDVRVSLNNAVLIPWHQKEWFELGGYRWGHGFLWNESFVRDSAEVYGSCVVAHGHRAGVRTGRTLDVAKCYAVGTLAEPFDMEYAKGRKSTLAWSAGFVWGEVKGDKAALWLHEQPRNEQEWRLPL